MHLVGGKMKQTIHRYADFEDWFDEIENYGMRSERLHEEMQAMTPERMIEWLRAVWKCSREEVVYHEKYDAHYSPTANEWTESKCHDPTCEYCRKRPERPL
jgi:transposase